MTLEKIIWEEKKHRLCLHLVEREEDRGERRRIVEIRPSRRWCRRFPIIAEESVRQLSFDHRGRKVVEMIEVAGVATLILINNYQVRGSESGAHRVDGPYLLVT